MNRLLTLSILAAVITAAPAYADSLVKLELKHISGKKEHQLGHIPRIHWNTVNATHCELTPEVPAYTYIDGSNIGDNLRFGSISVLSGDMNSPPPAGKYRIELTCKNGKTADLTRAVEFVIHPEGRQIFSEQIYLKAALTINDTPLPDWIDGYISGAADFVQFGAPDNSYGCKTSFPSDSPGTSPSSESVPIDPLWVLARFPRAYSIDCADSLNRASLSVIVR